MKIQNFHNIILFKYILNLFVRIFNLYVFQLFSHIRFIKYNYYKLMKSVIWLKTQSSAKKQTKKETKVTQPNIRSTTTNKSQSVKERHAFSYRKRNSYGFSY